jgi:hypothetical protein
LQKKPRIRKEYYHPPVPAGLVFLAQALHPGIPSRLFSGGIAPQPIRMFQKKWVAIACPLDDIPASGS